MSFNLINNQATTILKENNITEYQYITKKKQNRNNVMSKTKNY